MPIDPRIALGYQAPQFESPVNMMMMAQKMQSGQQENQLRQAQMENYQAEATRRNELLPYERDKLIREAEAAKVTGLKSQSDLLDSRLKQSRFFLDTIDPNDPNAPSAFLTWHQANHDDPIIGPALQARGVTVDSARAQIDAAMAQPGGFAKLLAQSKLGAEKFAENTRLEATAAAAAQAAKAAKAPTVTTVVDPKNSDRTLQIDARTYRGGSIGDPGVIGESVKQTQTAQLDARELAKREATYPQATAAVKSFESKADNFIKDLETLRDDPGLSQITGTFYGRTGSISAAGSRAQALYDKITAKGGFQALQDLRDASKTGGALGNISNQEGKQLTSSFAAIDRRQQTEDVQAAFTSVINDIKGSKARTREAYDMTYAYKKPSSNAAGGETPAVATPGIPSGDAIAAEIARRKAGKK